MLLAKSVARTLALAFQSKAEGAMLTGSVMTSPAAFGPRSDVDLIVYADDLASVVDTMPFFTPDNIHDAVLCIRQNSIGGLASKGIHHHILVSVNVLSSQAMHAIISMTDSDVVYYRTTSNAKHVRLAAFTGASIGHVIRAEAFDTGFLAYEPVLRCIEGVPYIGIAPDAFLAPVETVFGSEAFLGKQSTLWRTAVHLAAQSHVGSRACSGEMLSEMFVRSKVKRENMSKESFDFIRRKVLETYGHLRAQDALPSH